MLRAKNKAIAITMLESGKLMVWVQHANGRLTPCIIAIFNEEDLYASFGSDSMSLKWESDAGFEDVESEKFDDDDDDFIDEDLFDDDDEDDDDFDDDYDDLDDDDDDFDDDFDDMDIDQDDDDF
ncbi:MAG: hypothetical protein JXR73_17190 [Candidatus Omnitrophica bacterium]|nr:hypothetical protein [Candidatus Omnitrophota bacterium]